MANVTAHSLATELLILTLLLTILGSILKLPPDSPLPLLCSACLILGFCSPIHSLSLCTLIHLFQRSLLAFFSDLFAFDFALLLCFHLCLLSSNPHTLSQIPPTLNSGFLSSEYSLSFYSSRVPGDFVSPLSPLPSCFLAVCKTIFPDILHTPSHHWTVLSFAFYHSVPLHQTLLLYICM